MGMKRWTRLGLASVLAVSMALGGATGAFADSKGKGHGNNQLKSHQQQQWNHGKQQGVLQFNGGVQIIMIFNDVEGADVEWASRYIARLAAKGIFEGYEDGSFQPRKPISRIEAITAAVRLMGFKEEAESKEKMNANLNFKDADQIKKKYPWAVGYVAVALENDLFLETDTAVHPDRPADRLWATMLLVKALKLEDEALAKMNAKLPFKDAKDIPAGAVGYVAVAVEKGLIDGYEDNTFRPNRTVTRAELAALLDRTDSQLPDGKDGEQKQVASGRLKAVSGQNVLIVESGGKDHAIQAHEGVYVWRDGKVVTLADLVPGDELKIIYYDNMAIFIEVTKPAQDQPAAFTKVGLFTAMTLNEKGRIATITISENVDGSLKASVYQVADDVKITGGTLPATNKVVQLKGTDNLVNEIVILQ